jgi:hypothetical protein
VVANAAAWEEMARDRLRWDEDMDAARRACEIHEIASQRRHRQNLARRQANCVCQTDDKGSNAVDASWSDALM